MATAKLKFPPIGNPKPTGIDATTPVGKLEQVFQQWASALVQALQLGNVEIPTTVVAPAATSDNPSAAALAASSTPGPVKPAPPAGKAGGDLSGTYPSPRVEKVQGKSIGDAAFASLSSILSAVSAMQFIPSGMISMWSGTIATIPTGWFLCDGTNSTPDLRSKFILSVGAAEDPGATGGTTQHKHGPGALANSSDSAGTPSGTNAPEASHTHSVTSNVSASVNEPSITVVGTNLVSAGGTTAAITSWNGTGIVAGSQTVNNPAQTVTVTNNAVMSGPGSPHTHVFAGNALAPHTHTISGLTDVNQDLSGNTDAAHVLPPYFKLAFIMKA